MTGTHTE